MFIQAIIAAVILFSNSANAVSAAVVLIESVAVAAIFGTTVSVFFMSAATTAFFAGSVAAAFVTATASVAFPAGIATFMFPAALALAALTLFKAASNAFNDAIASSVWTENFNGTLINSRHAAITEATLFWNADIAASAAVVLIESEAVAVIFGTEATTSFTAATTGALVTGVTSAVALFLLEEVGALTATEALADFVLFAVNAFIEFNAFPALVALVAIAESSALIVERDRESALA